MLLAALALTLLNALEPLVIDDTAYVAYARQIVSHPLDPYGFEINWRQGPEPAFSVIAPLVLPYWLAGAMAIFGDQPSLLKLSLLPFALALCASLRSLFARFSPGLEAPLLWMTVLSPWLLPSFNLMLDVPALALSLSGLVLFMAACEQERTGLVIVAGLLFGVAMQTKYNAAISLAALVAYGLIHGKTRQALLAAAVAAVFFASWEGLVVLRYGESHLLHCALQEEAPQRCDLSPWCARVWGLGITSLLGAVAPAVALLGLVGRRLSARWIAAAMVVTTLVFAVIPFLPRETVQESDVWPHLFGGRPEQILFAGLGLAVVVAAASVLRKLDLARSPADRFLLVWLGLELIGILVFSPFLATRRVIRLTLVLTLVCGRLAAQATAEGQGRAPLRWVTAWGITLGLLFFTSDASDAVARRNAVDIAQSRLQFLGADRERETVWFIGRWGFQFYAERAGMKTVNSGRSRLEEGDWLLLTEGVDRQPLTAPRISPSEERVVSSNPWPWSTIPSFYAGPLAIRRQAEAQIVVWIHRVVSDFVPPPVESPGR